MKGAANCALLAIALDTVAGHGMLTKPQPRQSVWRDPSMAGYTDSGSIHRQYQPVATLNGMMTRKLSPAAGTICFPEPRDWDCMPPRC